METCHWYCITCNVKMGKFIPSIARLNDRVAEVDSKVVKLESELTVCSGKIVKVKEDVDEKVSDADRRIGQIEKDVKMMNGRIIKMQQEVEKELQQFSTDVNNVKLEVDKQLVGNSKQITDLSDKITDIFNGQESNWSDVVKKEVDKSLETVTGNTHDVQNALSETRGEAEEHRDKESRRNNIILYKVPESNAARAEDRNKDDISFCLPPCM